MHLCHFPGALAQGDDAKNKDNTQRPLQSPAHPRHPVGWGLGALGLSLPPASS